MGGLNFPSLSAVIVLLRVLSASSLLLGFGSSALRGVGFCSWSRVFFLGVRRVGVNCVCTGYSFVIGLLQHKV